MLIVNHQFGHCTKIQAETTYLALLLNLDA